MSSRPRSRRSDSDHNVEPTKEPPTPDRGAFGVAAETLRAAIDQAAESITIADPRGRIVYANLAAEGHMGRPRAELIGRHFVTLTGDQDASRNAEISRIVSEGGTWSGAYVVTSPATGSPMAIDLVVSPVRNTAGRVTNVVAIGRDVTRERSLEGDLAREVRQRAEIVSMISRLEATEDIEAQARELAVAMTQVEDITFVRVVALGPGDLWYRIAAQGYEGIDFTGPRPGSTLLRSIRRRARSGPWVESTRRWAIAGLPLDAAGITAVAFAPILHRGVLVGLLLAGTDIDGVATLERRLPSIGELADVASAVLGPVFADRAETADVRGTIERLIDEAAFHIVYQPIVRLRDGAVLGYEALTRFTDGSHPEVRFAEASAVGFGLDLERATLRAAVEGAIALPSDTLLSVNVSPALINQRLHLEDLLSEPAQERPLVLEITEREPVEDYEALRDAISSMAIQVRWAIDDAGAGYASLRHILELRPHFVKLDRALIANVALDPARQALLAGLLHFSQALGTTLIAEGIETNAERLVLEDLGVTAGQGYLFGRPQRARLR